MTHAGPQILWSDTVPSGTFRVIDFGADPNGRFGVQQQRGPNRMGETWWEDIGLPLGDVLEAAFAALYQPGALPA